MAAEHSGDLVVLREFAMESEALVAEAVLRAAGIPYALLRDDAGGLHPALTFSQGIRLVVPRSAEAQARALLAEES